MAPPLLDIKAGWLAAAAATGAVSPMVHAATPANEPVGVVTAVRPGVQIATTERIVYIGNSITFGERLKTDSQGIIHILFMDQSSMTLGPNSELVIDEFVFKPKEQQGAIAVSLIKGALRVVGGFISKYTGPQSRNGAQIRTATATIGIRGGISLVEVQDDWTRGVFLFGQQMEVTSPDGQKSQTVLRPGFSVTARRDQMDPPVRIPAEDLAKLLGSFETRGNQQAAGGAGALISTNDRPSGLISPAQTVAVDRVQRAAFDGDERTLDESLRTLLGSGLPPIQS